MVQRSTCLYHDKLVGIETIYTVIDGMQINIPEKVESLREKSRNNELFCPCGCGANLILVAGDRNLRRQHFRLKDGQSEKACNYISEGPTTVDSLIVLKCWLDDKCPNEDIRSRVPISAIDDTNRRFELSLLARDSGIAISYCNDRANLSDEKMDALSGNTARLRLYYICDTENSDTFAQYPEMMMKVQKRQGYCLFLTLAYDEQQILSYAQTELDVVFFHLLDSGTWVSRVVANDALSKFSFNDGNLEYVGTRISKLVEQDSAKYLQEVEKRRLAEKQLIATQRKQKRRTEEKLYGFRDRQKSISKTTVEDIHYQKENSGHADKATDANNSTICDCIRADIDSIIDNDQEHPFIDSKGNRWARCKYCGQINTDNNFATYGGVHQANLGKCRECNRKGVSTILPKYNTPIKATVQPMICPKCGGKLVERMGCFGRFVGCTNFPKCKYSR